MENLNSNLTNHRQYSPVERSNQVIAQLVEFLQGESTRIKELGDEFYSMDKQLSNIVNILRK